MRIIHRCGAAYDQGAALGIIGLLAAVFVVPSLFVASFVKKSFWLWWTVLMVVMLGQLVISQLVFAGNLYFAVATFSTIAFMPAIVLLYGGIKFQDDEKQLDSVFAGFVLTCIISLSAMPVWDRIAFLFN